MSLLHRACLKGYEELVEFLLKQGLNVRHRDKQGSTAFHKACWRGFTSIAKLLIQYDADINCDDAEGATGLHKACWNGAFDTVQWLVENKALIEKRDHNLATALHNACWQGHLDIVKYLLKNKANVNSMDRNGNSPLFDACSQGRLPVIELLLQFKADLNARNQKGNNALIVAVKANRLDIVKWLLNKFGLEDLGGNDVWSKAVSIAQKHKMEELTKILIQANSNQLLRESIHNGMGRIYQIYQNLREMFAKSERLAGFVKKNNFVGKSEDLVKQFDQWMDIYRHINDHILKLNSLPDLPHLVDTLKKKNDNDNNDNQSDNIIIEENGKGEVEEEIEINFKGIKEEDLLSSHQYKEVEIELTTLFDAYERTFESLLHFNSSLPSTVDDEKKNEQNEDQANNINNNNNVEKKVERYDYSQHKIKHEQIRSKQQEYFEQLENLLVQYSLYTSPSDVEFDQNNKEPQSLLAYIRSITYKNLHKPNATVMPLSEAINSYEQWKSKVSKEAVENITKIDQLARQLHETLNESTRILNHQKEEGRVLIGKIIDAIKEDAAKQSLAHSSVRNFDLFTPLLTSFVHLSELRENSLYIQSLQTSPRSIPQSSSQFAIANGANEINGSSPLQSPRSSIPSSLSQTFDTLQVEPAEEEQFYDQIQNYLHEVKSDDSPDNDNNDNNNNNNNNNNNEVQSSNENNINNDVQLNNEANSENNSVEMEEEIEGEENKEVLGEGEENEEGEGIKKKKKINEKSLPYQSMRLLSRSFESQYEIDDHQLAIAQQKNDNIDDQFNEIIEEISSPRTSFTPRTFALYTQNNDTNNGDNNDNNNSEVQPNNDNNNDNININNEVQLNNEVNAENNSVEVKEEIKYEVWGDIKEEIEESVKEIEINNIVNDNISENNEQKNEIQEVIEEKEENVVFISHSEEINNIDAENNNSDKQVNEAIVDVNGDNDTVENKESENEVNKEEQIQSPLEINQEYDIQSNDEVNNSCDVVNNAEEVSQD